VLDDHALASGFGAGAGSASGLTKRIIACLDVRSNDDGDLVVTKGDQYDVRERDDAAAAAFSLAARMRSRLEDMRARVLLVERLGSQLAEAQGRRGAAASLAREARSAAAAAASR
jgi:hypothetical protein